VVNIVSIYLAIRAMLQDKRVCTALAGLAAIVLVDSWTATTFIVSRPGTLQGQLVQTHGHTSLEASAPISQTSHLQAFSAALVLAGIAGFSTRMHRSQRSTAVHRRCAAEGSIDDTIAKNDIVAYIVPTCPFCKKALRGLDQAGFEVTKIEAPKDSALRNELAEKVGETSVPQVWVKGQHVGGCNNGGMGGVLPLLKKGKIKELMEA